MSNRHSQQITADILCVIGESDRGGIGITKICHKSNVSHSRLQKFLRPLISAGNINTIKYDGKSTFVLTEKGAVYLEKYKQFTEYAESFGLDM